jgi:hypothetical protein
MNENPSLQGRDSRLNSERYEICGLVAGHHPALLTLP